MAHMLPRMERPPETDRRTRMMAALCYLNLLILIPACSRRRKEEFITWHLNQGVVLLAMATVCAALGLVPYCGEVSLWLTLLVDALSLVGLVNAMRGKAAPLPVVSALANRFRPFG